jgi:phosphoglycerol transferase MdoB-like AlkP superfamily enzyme
MRDRLRLFLLLFIFWMVFMSTARISFLSYNYDLSSALTFREMLLAMMHGLKMDLSITGYALALSGLFLTISIFIRGRWLYYGIATVTFLFLVVSTLIIIVDLELYRHWGFRMNTTPLFYMGSEAVGSVSVWIVVKTLSIGIALCAAFSWLYLRWIAPHLWSVQPTVKKSAFVLLTLTASMFLLIRGSLSVAPMNTGFVYFHETKMYANHAAINVVWNFFKSLSRTSHIEYPENFFDKIKTEQLFSELHPQSDSTYRVHNSEKPNVVLLIIESYTASVIEPLGGLKDISPRINALCKEGILFDQFYSSGDRTDKGLVSVLSAYPAQPNSSIIKYPQKTQHLPFLNQKMKALGYRTSFIYGGDADFANFRSYLAASGFENITETDDFDDDLNTSKWGVHDGYMLNRALEELDSAQSPFFKVILTQSSHEPFDVPMKPLLPPTSDENLFLNSCHYTDSCVGAFVDVLKTKEQWKNTLVVITADHGHRHPNNKPIQSKERFHIPLLIIGGALKQDSVIHTIGNQTDIANTLLAQVAKPDPDFIFSKNLLGNRVNEHAVFYFTDGYGFIVKNKFLVFDNTAKQIIVRKNVGEQEENMSKAYQQKLYSDFNMR